jgi:hypothetical protein
LFLSFLLQLRRKERKRERYNYESFFSLFWLLLLLDGWKNTRERVGGYIPILFFSPHHLTWLVVFRWRMRQTEEEEEEETSADLEVEEEEGESWERGCNHLSRRRRKTRSTWLFFFYLCWSSSLIISLSLTSFPFSFSSLPPFFSFFLSLSLYNHKRKTMAGKPLACINTNYLSSFFYFFLGKMFQKK